MSPFASAVAGTSMSPRRATERRGHLGSGPESSLSAAPTRASLRVESMPERDAKEREPSSADLTSELAALREAIDAFEASYMGENKGHSH